MKKEQMEKVILKPTPHLIVVRKITKPKIKCSSRHEDKVQKSYRKVSPTYYAVIHNGRLVDTRLTRANAIKAAKTLAASLTQ